MRPFTQELMSGASAAGAAFALLGPKCPLCLAAYAGPAGAALAAGVAGAGLFGFARRMFDGWLNSGASRRDFRRR